MINTKLKNRKELWDRLDKLTLVYKLQKALKTYKLRPEDGMFVPRSSEVPVLSPWVYVRPLSNSRCSIYNHVFFTVLDHIHSYCRECWKVVVRPRNLVELFDLYELQKSMDVACKCGIEPREIVDGLYGGYFYCRGKEQGLERYAQVRELIDEHLSPKTKVTLKRYCTEFEVGAVSGEGDADLMGKAKGPSDQIGDVTREERDMEIYIESHFPDTSFQSPHPDHVVAATLMGWIKWAYQHGDKSWKKFAKGPLVGSVITYHDKED